MKKIYVTKPYLPPLDEYENYLHTIWNSSILTNQGALHNRFEKELRGYLAVPHVTLTVNGHLALDLAIKALNLRGEVVTTPFTFASTAHAISMNGLTPVFCDIKPSDFTMDETKIEALITEKTCAIIPVHVYGYPCNVDAIQKIADRHHLKVIYDGAHAFGVKIGGRAIGSFGDITMFSFHATKMFHSIEGGALTYKNAALKQPLDLLKNFGIADAEHVEIPGINAKMNEFQAAMGLCNLAHIDEIIGKRKSLVLLYRELLQNTPGLHFAQLPDSVDYNYAYLPVFIDEEGFGRNRDETVSLMEQDGIFPRKYFHPLATQFRCYQEMCRPFPCPVAESAARSVITLPLYPDLEEDDVERICTTLLRCRKTTHQRPSVHHGGYAEQRREFYEHRYEPEPVSESSPGQ